MASASECFYFVYSEQITARRGSEEKIFRAYSGGSRTDQAKYGSKDYSLGSFSPVRATKTVQLADGSTKEIGGGSLPPGEWLITSYRKGGVGHSLMLTPSDKIRTSFPQRFSDGRPFLIHMTGPKGSWGCITLIKKDFWMLMDFLTGLKQPGEKSPALSWRGHIPLNVIYDGVDLNRRIEAGKAFENIA